MSTGKKILAGFLVLVLILLFVAAFLLQGNRAQIDIAKVTGTDPILAEPEAESIPTVDIAEPVGWKAGEAPVAAQGLTVTRFAEGLDHPRTMQALPNGDILVALTRAPKVPGEGGGNPVRAWIENMLLDKAGATGQSANQILLLRDKDGDGRAETRSVLLDGLASPSGMAWRDGTLYVANHDAVLAFPYELGEAKVAAKPKKLMDLAAGKNHWMRNLALSEDGTKLYVAVGSGSNIGENGMDSEQGRAVIWEYDLQKHSQRVFGAGMRNPNGLDFNPWSGELWTTVNERDMLGSDLVPDYLTNVPVGVQYGWPWVYWRDKIDQRVKAPMPAYLTEYARRPEYALGPHVAALGLVFSEGGSRMGGNFSSGAFIARHGSWNRKPPSGYDVVYVPFDDRGNPAGSMVEVLTGFLNDDGTTKGRPTWVEWAGDGALLVSDDTAGIIWRVIAKGAKPLGAIERKRGERLPPQKELRGDLQATFGKEDYAREEPAN